jgi:4-diphosphocytidyl-2-C-methyl-D-erythritol kinase
MTVSSVSLRAGCKINLYLHVGNRLPNGYHTLESLFLPLEEPHDILDICLPAKTQNVVRTSFVTACEQEYPIPDIDPQHNTLTRAAAWHAKQTGFHPTLDIRVRKGIPQGAGLGGGSSDAAALLLWLREQAALSGARVPPFPHFLESAAAIGADVPFFLQGKTALVEGIGEKTRPAANPHAGYFLLLLCPGLVISTAWAFAALDRERDKKNTPDGLTSEKSQAKSARAPRQGNDFEPIVFAAYPELSRLHKQLLQSGASQARMSGTGSSLFGLYREEKIARDTAKRLAKGGLSVYIQRLPES